MVEFRDATPADALAIATVQVATWRVAYRGLLPDELLDGLSVSDHEHLWTHVLTYQTERSGTVLATSNAAVIGFAATGPAYRDDADDIDDDADDVDDADDIDDIDDPALGELYAIYLDPASWGTGVGRRLHALALDRLRAEGFVGAVLWMLDSNARAERFYRRAGWVVTGQTRVEPRTGGVKLTERQLSHTLAEPPSRTTLQRM